MIKINNLKNIKLNKNRHIILIKIINFLYRFYIFINNQICIKNILKQVKYFLFLTSIILLNLKIIFMNKNNIIFKNPYDLKICLCTLGKMENKYAREFVEHYKRYGVDKIFIYDNNDIKGEKFDLVLSDYIKNK